MADINLLKLVQTWHHATFSDSTHARNLALSDDDINLNLIKLKVQRDVTWELTDASRDLPRTVNITKTPGSRAGMFGQVHTSKETENVIKVNLLTGVIKGLNRTVKLPLRHNDLITIFGNCLEIDPSKRFSEINKNNIKLGVSVEQELGPGGASAVVNCREKEFSGIFTCTVEMKGRVTVQGGLQHTISEIVKELKLLRSGRQDIQAELGALTVSGDTVTFSMSGEIEFHWEPEHEIVWNESR